MPRHDSAVASRLAEELIVPEPHGSPQQLAGRHRERGVPQQVVKPRPNPPRPQGMEQHPTRVGRLVRMVLVPQLAPGVLRIEKLVQFAAELLQLGVGQNADAGEVTMLLVELKLGVRQPVAIPLLGGDRHPQEVPDRPAVLGKIFTHGIFLQLITVPPQPLVSVQELVAGTLRVPSASYGTRSVPTTLKLTNYFCADA